MIRSSLGAYWRGDRKGEFKGGEEREKGVSHGGVTFARSQRITIATHIMREKVDARRGGGEREREKSRVKKETGREGGRSITIQEDLPSDRTAGREKSSRKKKKRI